VTFPFKLIRTVVFAGVTEVRFYDETLDHVKKQHPEIPVGLPSIYEAVEQAVVAPTHIEAGHSNSVIFVDANTTNASGDPLRVPVKIVERDIRTYQNLVFCKHRRRTQNSLEEIMKTDLDSFNVTYDRDSDVLYLSTPGAPAARGIEDALGIVWRYDRDGELIGVTIVDFYDRWYPRWSELSRELAKRFDISEKQAEAMLNQAAENQRSG